MAANNIEPKLTGLHNTLSIQAHTLFTLTSDITATATSTVTKNGTASFTLSGYYPLEIVGFYTSGNGCSGANITKLYITARESGKVTILYYLRQFNLTWKTGGTLVVKVLWVKE